MRFASKKTNSPMDYFSHDFSSISKTCDIHTIQSMHEVRDKTMMWKIMHNNANSTHLRGLFQDNIQSRSTRNNPPLVRNAETLGYYANSSIPRLTVAWNNTPKEHREINIFLSFKNITKRVISKYY